jgi:FAD/FMN-containing dehydrogenase
MRALDFGVSQGVPIAIRSGGHGLPGYAVCDGGVMIDLSGFSAVTVDRMNKIARARRRHVGAVRL